MKVLYQMDNKLPYEAEAVRFYNNCIRRYEELKKPFETQNKIRQEKKMVQQLRGGNTSGLGNPSMVNRHPQPHPRQSKVLPSDR